MSFNHRRASNLEIAIMIGNLNPSSTTRPCTQCNGPVPKTQTLLTCDKCRAKKKQQKARAKERMQAIEAGRGDRGFSTAPLLAVVAKQDAETAAKRAARRKDGAPVPSASMGSGSGAHNMAHVFQAILNEHMGQSKGAAAPKKKPAKKVVEAESSSSAAAGTKRKFNEVEANAPGAVYDAETAKKRMRGDMPMPKLEPISRAGGPSATTHSEIPPRKDVAKSSPAATPSSTSKPAPLTTRRSASNLPLPPKADTGAKPQKVQASLAGWIKTAPKSSQ